MAKFDFYVDPEFLRKLGRMSDIDKIAPKMLEEAAPILERHYRAELSAAMTGRYSKGEMLKSIKIRRPKQNDFGWFTAVFPTGVDSKGVRNAFKAAVLEYGSSRQNQPPRPWVTKAKKDAESEVYAKMQEVFEREVGR